MNTFQLLKSGATFKKDKIEKVQSMFTSEQSKKRSKSKRDLLNDSDDELVQLDL